MKRPKSEFKNVVTRDGADNIIINLSALPKKANLIIEGMNERSIQFREPKKKIAAQDIFTPSSPSPQVLDPANALINAGLVQLNKISPYLSHLPDTAMAEFLISPKSTATIAGRGLTSHKGLRSFLEDIASIRNIGTNHGIHFNGQALTGMQIFDRPENAPHITYGQAWASEVCIAEQKAFAFKQNVVIPLAIGTLELLRNLKADFQNAGVENNLNARVNEIEAIITKTTR